MTKYDEYKKALENAKVSRPEIRSDKGMFCYPGEDQGLVIGKTRQYSATEVVILDIDEALMLANFILDTFTHKEGSKLSEQETIRIKEGI